MCRPDGRHVLNNQGTDDYVLTMYLHEKEYYTAFLWVAIIKRKVCQRETLKNVASLCGVPSLNRCPPHNDHHNLKKSFAQGFIILL